MPFDLEKLTGTWKIVRSSENYGLILQKLGVPPEGVQKILEAKHGAEVKVTGNTVTVKSSVLGKTDVNTYQLGVECEESGPTGIKRKVTLDWEGDSLVWVYPNYDGKGLVVHVSQRMTDDNTLRRVYKVGDLEGWWDSQKV